MCAALTISPHPRDLQTSTSAIMANPSMVDPSIFENLQTKIDEDAEARDQIRMILQTLERQDRTTQSILSRAHSTPAADRKHPKRFVNVPDLVQLHMLSPRQRRPSKRRLPVSKVLLRSPRRLLTTSRIPIATPRIS